MAFDFDSGDYFLGDLPITITYPFTIAAIVALDNSSAEYSICTLADKNTADHYHALFATTTSVFQMASRDGGGTTSRASSTPTQWVAGSFNHACGIVRAADSRSAYFNGGERGNNTASRTVNACTTVGVGRLGDSTPAGSLVGQVAEVCVWNVALTDGEVLRLGSRINRCHPFAIRAQNIVFFRSFERSQYEHFRYSDGVALVATGTPTVTPFLTRTKLPIVRVPMGKLAGVDRTFEANLTITADLTSALSVERNCAANLTVDATLTNPLSVERNCAANLSADADLAVALSVVQEVVDTSIIPGGLFAYLVAHPIPINDGNWNLTHIGVEQLLAANLTVTADFEARTQVDRNMAAAFTADADLAAALTVEQNTTKLFAASLSADASIQALLSVDRPLAANLAINAEFASLLEVLRSLASNISVTADFTTSLAVERNLLANFSASADLQADLTVITLKLLAAQLNASADFQAALTVSASTFVQFASSLLVTAEFLVQLTIDQYREGDAWVMRPGNFDWIMKPGNRTWVLGPDTKIWVLKK